LCAGASHCGYHYRLKRLLVKHNRFLVRAAFMSGRMRLLCRRMKPIEKKTISVGKMKEDKPQTRSR
jgi:hypothetical protein